MTPGAGSICCSGLPVRFYWRHCVSGNHIEEAVDALMSAISRPPRVWNPYAERTARAEFRGLLRAAEEGRLTPIDHVKRISFEPLIDLFEIRWRVGITERNADRVRHGKASVRLYIVEHGDLGLCVVGLHCHEKDTRAADVTAAQNAEIVKAIQLYAQGLIDRWGIPELSAT